MRFDWIDIPAFGPFTDLHLEFKSSSSDLHLVYGRNEAGKSSLLRALRSLFYGIPVRTSDSFLHPNTKLLIGAGISDEENSLAFYRKKGNRNTLLGSDRTVLSESALTPFLGSVNEEFFQHMFGLNTESLRAGADRLLSGEGDLGTTIFSASLGGSPIDEALKSLEDEAAELFKAQARKSKIYLGIKEFQEAEKLANATSTSASKWRALKAAIKNAEVEFQDYDQKFLGRRSRRDEVERILLAIPILQKLRYLETEIAEVDLPELGSGFVEQVRRAQIAEVKARQVYELHQTGLDAAQKSLKKIPKFEHVLANSKALDELLRKSSQFHHNLDQKPELESKINSLNSQLGDQGGAQESLEIGQTKLAELRGLASELNQLGRDLTDLKKNASRIKLERKSREKAIKRFPDSADLEEISDLVGRADRFSTKREALPLQKRQLGQFQERAKILRENLGIEGDPRKIKVPGVESIREDEQEKRILEERVHELEDKILSGKSALAEEVASLESIVSQPDVFYESDLKESRDRRDELWEEIQQSGKIDPTLTAAISSADQVSDGLRRNSSLSAKIADHRHRIASLQASLSEFEGDLDIATKRLKTWLKAWRKKTGFCPSQSPTQLLGWRDDWEKLCSLHEDGEELELKMSEVEEEEGRLLELIGGGDFLTRHRELKKSLNQGNRQQGELSALQKQLAKDEVKLAQIDLELDEVTQRFESARASWVKSCQEVGIDSNLEPGSVLELVEGWKHNHGLKLQIKEATASLAEISKQTSDFEKLLQDTASNLNATASEDTLRNLYELAKSHQQRFQTVSEQISELQAEEAGLHKEWKLQVEELEELRKKAGTKDLDSAAAELEKRNALELRLSEQRESLASLAGQLSFTKFVEELAGQDVGSLEAEKAELDEVEAEFQGLRDIARTRLEELKREEKNLLEASDESAFHRQAAADAKSKLIGDARRYCQLQHAITLLKDRVEEYRQKTQGPMVEKTSHYFQRLTSGAFCRVVARLDEKDRPQLVAIRSDETEVPTTGLSEGTGDQLYLALRLAAIDLHLENHHAMPLILDDLLMTFDDERAVALFSVLEDFGEKTQVLIFTHHAHLKNIAGTKVHVHEFRNEKELSDS